MTNTAKRAKRLDAALDAVDRATARYEKWLRRSIPVVEADLLAKHRKMTANLFHFFRATHYRWAQVFPAALPDLATARHVLAVADLHVENFGTWRDQEGRLVWGVNDVDDTADLPFTYDLVRLAASVLLAKKASRARWSDGGVAEGVLAGYRAALHAGGSPCVLGARWQEIATIVQAVQSDPGAFWKKLQRSPPVRARVPGRAKELLLDSLPATRGLRIVRRVAGLGSLGRQRFAAIALWQGAPVAREVKRLAPPAAVWAEGKREGASNAKRLLARAVRSPDPFLVVKGQWIVRRLAPDNVRIELESLPAGLDVSPLLFAMGWETANIHLGSASPESLLRDLRKLGGHSWLTSAATTMEKRVDADWRAWRAERRR